jgi:hypothetical protein
VPSRAAPANLPACCRTVYEFTLVGLLNSQSNSLPQVVQAKLLQILTVIQ